jgi:hypothetical protein
VDAFRADLGNLNPNEPGSLGSGRREINWDGVPAAQNSPNPFPPDFFNAPMTGRARGAVFANPPSDAFQVSSSPATPRFANLNPTYSTAFGTFSAPRLFTQIGSNTTTVNFFVPGEQTPASVTGFGSVFTDVDTVDSTSIEFLNSRGQTMFSRQVLPTPGNASLSFLGASFPPEDGRVAQVRITSGAAAPGPNDVTQTPGNPDIVVMDDFIYGEPVALAPPELDLSGKRRQRLRKTVKVKASCNEPCTVEARGKVKNVKKGKLRRADAELDADETANLKLRLKKKALRSAENRLNQGRKVTARITVTATDFEENSVDRKRKVTLRL